MVWGGPVAPWLSVTGTQGNEWCRLNQHGTLSPPPPLRFTPPSITIMLPPPPRAQLVAEYKLLEAMQSGINGLPARLTLWLHSARGTLKFGAINLTFAGMCVCVNVCVCVCVRVCVCRCVCVVEVWALYVWVWVCGCICFHKFRQVWCGLLVPAPPLQLHQLSHTPCDARTHTFTPLQKKNIHVPAATNNLAASLAVAVGASIFYQACTNKARGDLKLTARMDAPPGPRS